MSFVWLRMLWLLLLIPVLVVLYILLQRKKRTAALRFANLQVVRQAVAKTGFRRHVPPLLFLLAVAMMIVALARPTALVTLPSERGTIVLAMDVSGSMRADDIEPSRLEASQEAARLFVEQQPRNVKIGLVVFAGTSVVSQAPTTSRQELLDAIDRFRLQRGTAIGAGILTSLQLVFEDTDMEFSVPEIVPRFPRSGRGTPLGEPENERDMPPPVPPGSYESAVVVLLTDGQTTQGPDPIGSADRAADLGIRIYTVGLGTPEGAVIGFAGRSMRVRLDEETLKSIAARTGGEYFRAGSNTDLNKIYNSLSTQLIMAEEETEITVFATAIAAILALAAVSLSLWWFGRLA